MRFDDSLATVLAADTATGFGAAAAWRQLVDLTARGRVPDVGAATERLRGLRDQVPAAVRAASARALASAEPPAALVALFATDEPAIAATVLRAVQLPVADWLRLLPGLSPATRSVLRHRRDLPPEIVRGLASFGATDFVLGHDAPAVTGAPPELSPPQAAPPEPELPRAPLTPTPFVAVGEIARALPVVAEAMRRAEIPPAEPPRSDIADLVARIDAFRRGKPAAQASPASAPATERFRFETDAAGTVRWVEDAPRGPLIGVSLADARRQGAAQVEAATGIALRTRSTFRDVRLELAGESAAAGVWRLSGAPRFDRRTGRFEGLTGIARRERAVPAAPSASDSLRQLVHELRTPANAIAGFAELIGTELLGPVPVVYRERAQYIQHQAAGLTAAIDDLDTAARIEGNALPLRPDLIDVAAMVEALASDWPALLVQAEPATMARADERATARLLDRLLATLTAVAAPGERLHLQIATEGDTVRLHVTRPMALPASDDGAPPAGDAEGGPLLGVGFMLRLVRSLAAALGGSFRDGPDRLTLRLPAAHVAEMERAAAQ